MKRPVSLSEYVYETLRSAILAGDLEPGEPVREEAVAERLEVSRTPVREALFRLETEGLLEAGGPRGGLVVPSTSLQEALETYEVREALEGLVARRAAASISPAELDELRLLLRAMEAAADDARRLLRLHDDFHVLLYRACRNRLLHDTAQQLRDTLGRFRDTTLAEAGRGREHVQEHQALLEAIERRDQEAAESIARQHIRRAKEVGLEMLRSLQDPMTPVGEIGRHRP